MTATEALFSRAFSRSATITAKAAADVLGMNVKTLAQMSEAGLIKYVLRGKLRAYTEADLRSYLARETMPAPEEREEPGNVVRFTSLRARGGNNAGRGRIKKAPTFSERLAAKNRT